MEFNEKLQYLRKQHDLTQEQLAEKLFVSRTAVSKWESGKGYPNIESLKCISKEFGISIDELLSGEELIVVAEAENHENLRKEYRVIAAVLDVLAIGFIVLPLYGKPVGGHFYSVNLFSVANMNAGILALYWAVFLLLTGTGIAGLLLLRSDRETWRAACGKLSLGLSVFAILFFAAVREPYVTPLLFLLFLGKSFLFLKQSKMA